MRIRRIRITLPPRLSGSAVMDARRIAEAVAGQLAAGPAAPPQLRVQLAGNGQNGAGLARATAHEIARSTGKKEP